MRVRGLAWMLLRACALGTGIGLRVVVWVRGRWYAWDLHSLAMHDTPICARDLALIGFCK